VKTDTEKARDNLLATYLSLTTANYCAVIGALLKAIKEGKIHCVKWAGDDET
jgi:hypothetical protein